MRPNGLHSLRELRLRILDDMALVQYAIVPVHILETGDVVANNLIRGNDNVVLLQLLDCLAFDLDVMAARADSSAPDGGYSAFQKSVLDHANELEDEAVIAIYPSPIEYAKPGTHVC